MSGLGRRVLFLGLTVALAACTRSVEGTGSLAAGVLVPATSGQAGSTPPARPRDPVALANRVDVRAGDLPRGWQAIPGSATAANDSVDWAIVCARDAGVSLGSFGGARTPDFSPNATVRASQVGSATGLFADDSEARAFVALFRSRSFGACLAGEAGRRWADAVTGSVAAFVPRAYQAPPAPEAALMEGRFTVAGRLVYAQFVPIRTGPIVTLLDTLWQQSRVDSVVQHAATSIGRRQRTA